MSPDRDRLLSRYLAPAAGALIVASDSVGLVFGLQTNDVSVLIVAFLLTTTLVAPTVGLLILRRHPRHVVGWLLMAHGLVNTPIMLGDSLAAYAAQRHQHVWAAAVETQLSQAMWPALYLCIMLVAYVFPTGRFLSHRWRRWVGWCVAAFVVFVITATISVDKLPDPVAGMKPPLGHVGGWIDLLGFPALLMIMASLIGAVVCARARLRHAEGDERRQLLWFTWAALSVPVGLGLCWFDLWVVGDADTLTLIGVILVGSVLPIGIGMAILRSQLFDIEVVLSRTLTYGALTALVVGVYAAVLLGVGALFDNRSLAGFVGVVVVAIAIQPVHARLRRRVDRWVFGDRADPYAALRRLSDRLEATADPAQAMHIVTTSIAEALRVDAVSVELDSAVPAAVATPAGDGLVRVPLVHHEHRLGQLVIDVPRGRQLSTADRQMLDDLARHAAVVVNALRLTLDLQQSRARLVSAREEERRRLRRDLHDGVGPSLAAMVLKLNVLGATVVDPSSTELLTEVRDETKAAIAEIRRLVDDLRPPALDEVGLLGALRQRSVSLSAHGGDHPLVVEVDGPGSLPPLPAAAEVAAYRIAMEAITNVVRHAAATRCLVVVSLDDAAGLVVEVSDNGRGLHVREAPERGVGLASMRERAAELGGSCVVSARPGGGTLVRAIIPLPRATIVALPHQPADAQVMSS